MVQDADDSVGGLDHVIVTTGVFIDKLDCYEGVFFDQPQPAIIGLATGRGRCKTKPPFIHTYMRTRVFEYWYWYWV